jgi:hypothetical protein
MKRFEEDLKCEGKGIRTLWVPGPRDLPKREGHTPNKGKEYRKKQKKR